MGNFLPEFQDDWTRNDRVGKKVTNAKVTKCRTAVLRLLGSHKEADASPGTDSVGLSFGEQTREKILVESLALRFLSSEGMLPA